MDNWQTLHKRERITELEIENNHWIRSGKCTVCLSGRQIRKIVHGKQSLCANGLAHQLKRYGRLECDEQSTRNHGLQL